MGIGGETALKFCCGVCASSLTDATALFTSCGHFFCLGNNCTLLSAGSQAGKCEQCGQKCDAGTLENKAARYDDQVKQFVFASVEAELKNIAEIVKFHDRHYNLLVQNAASLAKKNISLKEEIHETVKENEALRTEIEFLKKKQTYSSGLEVDARSRIKRTDPRSLVAPPKKPDIVPARVSGEKLKSYQSYAQSRVNDKARRRHDTSPVIRSHADNTLRQDIAHADIARNEITRRRENTHLQTKNASDMKPSNNRSISNRYTAAPKPYESIAEKRDSFPTAHHLDSNKFRGIDSRSKLSQGRLLKRTSYGPQSYARTPNNAPQINSSELFGGSASRRVLPKTTRLLPQTDPKSGNSVMPTYGSSLYASIRTRKPTVPVNPSTVSKFCSTRGINRSSHASLHTSTRNLGKSSWQARVSTVPRPTVTTDDIGRAWKKQRRSKHSMGNR